MSTKKTGPSPWLCEECEEPVLGEDGYLEIVNVDPKAGRVGGRPQRPTPDWPKLTQGGAGVIDFVPYSAVPEQPKRCNEFQCVHRSCDRNGQQGDVIPISDIDTHEGWIKAVRNAGRKTWMGKEDLLNMMDYYGTNRALLRSMPVGDGQQL